MMGVIVKRIGLGLLIAIMSFVFALGCVPGMKKTKTEPAVDSPPETIPIPKGEEIVPEKIQTYLIHTVQWKGESLSIIAKWYTGEVDNWKLIAEHNPILDPNQIRIGDQIIIPDEMVKSRKPMPRAFVDRHRKAPAGGASPGKPQKDDAPELFGPKEFKSD